MTRSTHSAKAAIEVAGNARERCPGSKTLNVFIGGNHIIEPVPKESSSLAATGTLEAVEKRMDDCGSLFKQRKCSSNIYLVNVTLILII